MFKPLQVVVGNLAEPVAQLDDESIKHVFKVFHGFYGNLFLSKFSTGSVEHGEDQGIANARRIWAYSLREFDLGTIKLALRRCQDAHPEFPPSLPQFSSLCYAIKPREVYRPAPPAGPPAIAMSEETRERIRAENRARATEAAHRAKPEPLTGLDALKQAIASAVAEAGGDEAATLLQLDRILSPRRPA